MHWKTANLTGSCSEISIKVHAELFNGKQCQITSFLVYVTQLLSRCACRLHHDNNYDSPFGFIPATREARLHLVLTLFQKIIHQYFHCDLVCL